MCKVSTAIWATALVGLLAAPSARAETLTNDKVVDMVKSELSEEIIIKKIKSSECRFDTSAEKLVELKKAGVPEKIIDLMLDTHNKWKTRIKAAVQVAIQGFKDTDPRQHERSLRELKRLGPDAIPEIVRQGLASEEDNVRAMCCRALGLIGHRDALEPLLEALVDRTEKVRTEAASGLKYVVGDGDRERVLKQMKGLLKDIEKPSDGAVRLLGHLGDTSAAPELRKMAQGDTSPRMRAAACAALGQMGDKGSLELLIKRLLDDRDGAVREAAAVSLAQLGEAKAIPPLVKAFQRYPQDRRRLVGPMARFRDKMIMENLIEALDDDDSKVKELAWQALKLLTGEQMKKDRSVWKEWWELDGRRRF